jgi:hypothetical protein
MSDYQYNHLLTAINVWGFLCFMTVWWWGCYFQAKLKERGVKREKEQEK